MVVTGVSEFELKKTEIVSKEEIYEDAIDNEAVEATKQRIIEIHDQIENLLYNTGLVMGEKISPEKMSRINDLVLALQKDSLNLGSVITSDND